VGVVSRLDLVLLAVYAVGMCGFVVTLYRRVSEYDRAQDKLRDMRGQREDQH
jgi:hypothetical protein